MKYLRTFLALLTASVSIFAQATTEVERSVSTQDPVVETRTYEKDGKMVTERVTTTRVKEVEAVSVIQPKTYKAAIFISNRAGAALDEKIMALEDFITARITDLGFQVLSRETVADALRAFDPATASGNARPEGSLEAKLTEQSSALRLSQNLGADYLIVASIASFGTNKRAVDAYGVKGVFADSNLRVTYKILDGTTGGSLTADTIKVTSSSRQTENASEDKEDAINEVVKLVEAKCKENNLSLPNLASPALNRIKAETYREAAEIAGPEDSYQDQWFKAKSDSCAKLRAKADELEQSK